MVAVDSPEPLKPLGNDLSKVTVRAVMFFEIPFPITAYYRCVAAKSDDDGVKGANRTRPVPR